jgi:hypothetical protein
MILFGQEALEFWVSIRDLSRDDVGKKVSEALSADHADRSGDVTIFETTVEGIFRDKSNPSSKKQQISVFACYKNGDAFSETFDNKGQAFAWLQPFPVGVH